MAKEPKELRVQQDHKELKELVVHKVAKVRQGLKAQQDQAVVKEPKELRVRQDLREPKERLVHKVHKVVEVDKELRELLALQVHKDFKALKVADQDHKVLKVLQVLQEEEVQQELKELKVSLVLLVITVEQAYQVELALREELVDKVPKGHKEQQVHLDLQIEDSKKKLNQLKEH